MDFQQKQARFRCQLQNNCTMLGIARSCIEVSQTPKYLHKRLPFDLVAPLLIYAGGPKGFKAADLPLQGGTYEEKKLKLCPSESSSWTMPSRPRTEEAIATLLR